MENINSILLIAQVLLSISLIALILIQHGKGADAGAAFGSGASATVFGARGSGNFLSKATTALLFCFSWSACRWPMSRAPGVRPIVSPAVLPHRMPIVVPMQEGDDVPPAVPQQRSSQESDLPPAE